MKRIDFEHGTITRKYFQCTRITDAGGTDTKSFV